MHSLIDLNSLRELIGQKITCFLYNGDNCLFKGHLIDITKDYLVIDVFGKSYTLPFYYGDYGIYAIYYKGKNLYFNPNIVINEEAKERHLNNERKMQEAIREEHVKIKRFL